MALNPMLSRLPMGIAMAMHDALELLKACIDRLSSTMPCALDCDYMSEVMKNCVASTATITC